MKQIPNSIMESNVINYKHKRLGLFLSTKDIVKIIRKDTVLYNRIERILECSSEGFYTFPNIIEQINKNFHHSSNNLHFNRHHSLKKAIIQILFNNDESQYYKLEQQTQEFSWISKQDY